MKFQKSKVLLISFAHFTHDIFSALLAPILPLLIDKMGITLTQASLFDIARKLPALFNPVLGIVAERTNAKYFVILAPAVTAISMGLLGVVNSYFLALLLLFIAGISATFFHIPSPAMIKEFSGDESGKGMSYFMAAGESARTIGPLLAAAVISMWGLEGILRLSVLGIIASIFLYIKLKDYTPKYQAKKFETTQIKDTLRKVSPFFIKLGSFMMLNYTSKFSLSLFLPVYLTQHGKSAEFGAIAFGIMQAGGILGAFFGGRISDKIGRKKALLFQAIGASLFLALFLVMNSIFVLPFLGFFLFSQSPVLLAFTHDLKTDTPNFINSLYMFINFGISSLIVLFAGILGQHLGLFKTFEIAAILTLLSIPFIYTIKTQ
ncbi:MFS transporter [Caminibacter pacificus]|uniref:MFS transporter n=1 Tax=Caminibacter pacificus TaxID=1424653 RepID=A0AAJ4REI5_9BACT|nr:MFS transporter [Caminibacter pacificus]QCI28144.1 MFS transporter [Caminibacter pacificus]ROR41144.1 FSR family fosmidomycin resistance protein-like MFS transporter [Caminibacter pacificus]